MDRPLVRQARSADASAVARIYIESWRDTYPGMIPGAFLVSMSLKDQTGRWRRTIRMPHREAVLVAEDPSGLILGMTSLGRARDRDLGFEGEIYTLYVDPDCLERGVGRALLAAGFDHLRDAHYHSCVIWAHAQNHARFFYEAMGGRLVAQRVRPLMGVAMPELAFGWSAIG